MYAAPSPSSTPLLIVHQLLYVMKENIGAVIVLVSMFFLTAAAAGVWISVAVWVVRSLT